MKKIISIIISLFVCVGCVNNLEVVSYTSGEIMIHNVTCALTKGASVTTDNLSSNYTDYSVYAYSGNNAYMDNVHYTLENDTFVPDRVYYWGSSSLDFWVYPENQAHTAITQYSDRIVFSYNHPASTTHTDAIDSKDLLFAYTTQTPNNLVNVTFDHALSSVKIIYNTTQAAHHITNITLSDINVSGNCEFKKDRTFTWTDTSTGTYSQDMNVFVTADNTQINDGNMVFFVVPGTGFTVHIDLDDGRHMEKSFDTWELESGTCSMVLINDDITGHLGPGEVDPEDAPTSKGIDQNPDGTYYITIEAYVTGKIIKKTVITESPIDFVLVLDVSGSMNYDMEGNSTSDVDERRITALKEALNAFADTIAVHSTKYSVEHRVSLVKFASELSNNVGNQRNGSGNNYSQIVNHFTSDMNTIKTNANALVAGGGTRISNGVNLAVTEFGSSRSDATKVCIVFTDGGPGDYGWSYWDRSGTGSAGGTRFEAQSAVNYAHQLKQMGVTVYTVGIFSDSSVDSDEFMDRISSNYADATTFTRGTSTITYTYEPVNATARQAYDNGYYARSSGGNYYKVAYRNGNRYYYRTGATAATNVRVYDDTQFYIRVQHTEATGYSNGTKTKNTYYTKSVSATSLVNVFSQIASETSSGGASISLTDEAYAYDVISDIFNLPANYGNNPGDITFYSVAQTGYDETTETISWSDTPIDITSTLTWSLDDYSLKVQGWDYSENCCGEGCTGTGHKLVLRIDNLVIRDDISGKHYTNQYGSGLYDEDGNLVISFDSPYLNL